MKTGILLVDDDDNVRGAIVRALAEEGFLIDVASSVDEGLRLLNAVPKPQVIILDLHFPGPNGRVFLEKLEKGLKGVRVIVHTGRNDLLPADRAGKLNVFTYLNKGDATIEGRRASAEQLKFAINQAFKDIEAEKLRDRMEDYLRLQRMINTHRRGDDVLQEVCNAALAQVKGYTCHIRRLDGRKGDYELVAYAGPAKVRSHFSKNKKLTEWFSGEVARKGKACLYQDLQSEQTFVDFKHELLKGTVSQSGREYLDTIKAAYILPIQTDLFDEKHPVEAILNISGAEIGFFTAERMRLVQELLRFAQFAVSKQWLQQKRTEMLRDYQSSNKLLVDVSETLQHADDKLIAATVLTGISNIIRPEMISLFLYNEQTEKIEKRAEYVGNRVYFQGDKNYEGDETYAAGECLTGNVFKTGRELLINDSPTKHKLYDASRDEIDKLIVPSGMIEHYLAVPLKADNKVIGVIRSVNKKSSYYDERFPHVANDEHCLLPRGFSNDCRVILGIIASHLAVIINNSKLISKLNQKIKQLDKLSGVGHRISANYGLEAENLLELIVKETAEVMNSDICMLFLKNEEGDKVDLKQCYGIPLIPGAHYKLGERNTGRVARTGKPYKDKVEKPGKYDSKILELLRAKEGPNTELTSFMIVPITIEDDSSEPEHNIIGVVKVINKRPAHRLFDNEDLSLFQSFASQISIALAMSEQNRSTFKLVKSVGHEIANTVSMIVPNAEVFEPVLDALAGDLEKAAVLDPDQREKFARLGEMNINIRAAAAEARDFAHDLLAFSESRFLERKPMDINFLESHVTSFRQQPPPSVKNAHEIKLDFRLSGKPLICDIAESPFTHAVLNIVANAYQAMEGKSNGKLVITTSERENKGKGKIARIEITDNGKGIPRELFHKIFEADYSGRKGGNGIGLWLARMSLLRMKGRLSVKSEVDKYTTMIIELPISNSHRRANLAQR